MNILMIVEKNIVCRIRKIRDRYVLIGANKCFEINPMGKYIWDNIDGEKSIKEIVKSIHEEYDIDEVTLEHDVLRFLETLLSIDAINVVN